ncbi:hypothetical protein [Lentzea xinjiangensis]|uniref:VMAP-C domain-containing protein n=1 Tax=Lentzea xinjiangensis TaxID=402600 RepID=UPI001160AEF7|nr:hypothetical protein [Lentzea xinjiangensis]
MNDLLVVHEGLYGVLKAAFADVGVDLSHCATEDRGDGALILVPSTVSKSELADKLPERLVAELRRYNSTKAEAAKIKLRVVLHAGDIRQNEHGWVGHALNHACRILEADIPKTELRNSGSVLAVIASAHFYQEVIFDDAGSAPDSYHRIDVSVKSFQGHAWLRLHGAVMPLSTAPAEPAAVLPDPDLADLAVRGLFTGDEVKVLRELLADAETARLPMLVSRATGSVVPMPRFGSVWDAFTHLADVNAGPDGIPPAVEFLELLAEELGGDNGAELKAWAARKVRGLRRANARQERQAARSPLPAEPRLRLMIVVELDGIDDNRCRLSFWRQDDPLDWPPLRGEVGEVRVDELEQRIDDLIIDAEGRWSGQSVSVALDFVLPRPLLRLPISSWKKERRSGDPRPIVYDYVLSLRSLERMRATYWHRPWRVRWESSSSDTPLWERIHPYGAPQGKENAIDAVLSESRWVGLVMDEPPSPRPDPSAGPDALTAALRAGLPLVLWHPAARAEDLRAIVAWLVSGEGGILGLPDRHRHAQLSAAEGDLVRDLVVLLDDPNWTVALDGPAAPTSGGGRG